jgi:hypothetical protein
MEIKSYDMFLNPRIQVVNNINRIPPERNLVTFTATPRKFPIYVVKNGEEQIEKEVESIIPLKINVCKLIFAVDNDALEMELSNTESKWRFNYTLVFTKNIEKQDIEYLSRWIRNRTVHIGFEVKGLAKVNESITEFDLRLNKNQFKLGIDEFEYIFLKNTGLQYAYTREFNLSSPLIPNLSSRPALNEFYDNICNLQNNLEHALRVLRLSMDPLQVLTLIRQPLDGLRLLKQNDKLVSDISKELYVAPKILVNINSTDGAETAAIELTNALFNLFDTLFEFSSKAMHTKTKKPPVQLFKMNPDYFDAEFSLSLALDITNYLIERIRLSCKN